MFINKKIFSFTLPFLFILILITTCSVPDGGSGGGSSGGGSDLYITYDGDSLVKGRAVLFQTDEETGAVYKWSYKAEGDADYILVEGATTHRVLLVFIPTGQTDPQHLRSSFGVIKKDFIKITDLKKKQVLGIFLFVLQVKPHHWSTRQTVGSGS